MQKAPAEARCEAAGAPARDDRSGRLLALLRSETAPAHAALDARLRSPSGPMSPTTYTAFLRATSRIVLPLEVPLALRLGACFVNESVGERRLRLTHDLRLLGSEVATAWPALPAVDDLDAALGAGYVLVGSHLGGEMIARELYGRSAERDTPTTYVRLYAPHTGARWAAFLATLDGVGRRVDDAAHRRAATVAVALFTAFDLALDQEGVAR